MDTLSDWVRNARIDRTLNRLGTHVEPKARFALLQVVVAQEAKLGDGFAIGRWARDLDEVLPLSRRGWTSCVDMGNL